MADKEANGFQCNVRVAVAAFVSVLVVAASLNTFGTADAPAAGPSMAARTGGRDLATADAKNAACSNTLATCSPAAAACLPQCVPLQVVTTSGNCEGDSPSIVCRTRPGETLRFNVSLASGGPAVIKGWAEGRGIRVPLIAEAVADPEHSPAVWTLAFAPLDPGGFDIVFEAHKGGLAGHITPDRSESEGCRPCELPAADRFRGCPKLIWSRGCATVPLTVAGNATGMRVIDDPAFLARQLRLPRCTSQKLSDVVDPRGHFVVDPTKNLHLGRWLHVASPLAQPEALATVVWPRPTDEAYAVFTADRGPGTSGVNLRLAWAPYGCRAQYFSAEMIKSCIAQQSVVYTGESRTRTQLYNLPVALRVKPPGGFPKSHGRATFNVTTALSTVSAARIAYQYFPCAGDFATDGSRAYLHTHTKDEVVASIRDFWGPVPNRPGGMLGRRFAVVVTDGLCELAYGNIPTLEAQLRETLNVLHAAVHTAPNVTVYIKTNESPWTRGGGGCSVGRVLVANQLLLKLARARAPEWRVIDTFQTTVIRDDDNYDQMHYWRSTVEAQGAASGQVEFIGNAVSVTNTQIALNMYCSATDV